MLYLAKIFLKDLWIRVFLATALGFSVFHFWYLFAKLQFDQDNYFLHYNTIFGVDLVGVWTKLLILPISGLLIILLNFILSFYFFNKDKFLSYTLAISVVVFDVFLSIALVLIMRLNV